MPLEAYAPKCPLRALQINGLAKRGWTINQPSVLQSEFQSHKSCIYRHVPPLSTTELHSEAGLSFWCPRCSRGRRILRELTTCSKQTRSRGVETRPVPAAHPQPSSNPAMGDPSSEHLQTHRNLLGLIPVRNGHCRGLAARTQSLSCTCADFPVGCPFYWAHNIFLIEIYCGPY